MSKKHTNIKKIETTLVDIIIAVHGRFDILKRCLDALPEACKGISYKVYIIDNASPKEESDRFYPMLVGKKDILVYRNKENVGFPAACNQGFRKGYSPIVFFLNSDVILDPGSVDLLVRELDDPNIGVVGMKLVFPTDIQEYGITSTNDIRPAGKIQHIGLSTNLRGTFIHHLIGWSEDHPKVNSIREVYAVTGAALMTRRSIYKKIGGFFEGYGVGTWEDVDFCLSARDLGYNVVVNPKARGLHYTGATAEKYKIAYPFDFNRLIFLQRWASKINYSELWIW